MSKIDSDVILNILIGALIGEMITAFLEETGTKEEIEKGVSNIVDKLKNEEDIDDIEDL